MVARRLDWARHPAPRRLGVCGAAALVLAGALWPCAASAQSDPKQCAIVVVPGKTASASLASLPKRVQAACAVGASAAAGDLPRVVRNLRQQGAKRVILV